MSFGRILLLILLLWVFLYTCSYGLWTWNKKNRVGAAMVFILAITALVLPVYTIFFRD